MEELNSLTKYKSLKDFASDYKDNIAILEDGTYITYYKCYRVVFEEVDGIPQYHIDKSDKKFGEVTLNNNRYRITDGLMELDYTNGYIENISDLPNKYLCSIDGIKFYDNCAMSNKYLYYCGKSYKICGDVAVPVDFEICPDEYDLLWKKDNYLVSKVTGKYFKYYSGGLDDVLDVSLQDVTLNNVDPNCTIALDNNVFIVGDGNLYLVGEDSTSRVKFSQKEYGGYVPASAMDGRVFRVMESRWECEFYYFVEITGELISLVTGANIGPSRLMTLAELDSYWDSPQVKRSCFDFYYRAGDQCLYYKDSGELLIHDLQSNYLYKVSQASDRVEYVPNPIFRYYRELDHETKFGVYLNSSNDTVIEIYNVQIIPRSRDVFYYN